MAVEVSLCSHGLFSFHACASVCLCALQVARVETGTALSALKALVQLSEELKKTSRDTELAMAASQHRTSAVAVPPEATMLSASVRHSRDEAAAQEKPLKVARSAVLSLSRLTQGLALEAAAAANAAGWSIEGLEAVGGEETSKDGEGVAFA